MQELAKADRQAEDARRAKRAKRNATGNPNDATPSAETVAEAEILAAAQDSERKTTKKERKQAETRLSEAQQHKSANEAARMAFGGALAGRLGGKKKNYSWMTAGASGTSTPTRPTGSATTSATNTPAQEKARSQAKEKRFGTWDEDKDPGIQLRDVLPVLETDAMAPRAYIRGCEKLEA
jgi:Transcription initiation factor TFIID component TAF4 family